MLNDYILTFYNKRGTKFAYKNIRAISEECACSGFYNMWILYKQGLLKRKPYPFEPCMIRGIFVDQVIPEFN